MSVLSHQVEENLSLVSDAIDRTIANPTASHCWLNLMEQVREISSVEVLTDVVQVLKRWIPDQGLSGFYLATFLDVATGDHQYLKRAATLLTRLTPFDADRLAAFFHIAWQRTLLYSASRAVFSKKLVEAGLPDLSVLIGNFLSDRAVNTEKPKPRPIQQFTKVAIIAPQLSNTAHPPTKMALDQAETLVKSGIQVHLFSCQETVGPGFNHLIGTGANNELGKVDLAEWLHSFAVSPQVTLSDSRFSLMRRWIDMLDSIESFRPDAIIFVGLQSGLIASLYKKYPVLALGTNSLVPMVPADVWLTAQRDLPEVVSYPWGGRFPESEAWYHPYRIRRRKLGNPVSRGELGLSLGAITLFSVGNHLEVLITGEWAERMRALMADKKELVWILIGGKGEFPPALKGVAHERLRLISYTTHVMEILASGGIYVNPPAMGGGFSVAEAMSVGIPVLSFAESDGGDKLGSAAVSSMDEYFNRLDELIRDPVIRDRTGMEMQQRFSETLDLDMSGPSLLAACELAVERHLRRTTSTIF